jgi:hypothetical protein
MESRRVDRVVFSGHQLTEAGGAGWVMSLTLSHSVCGCDTQGVLSSIRGETMWGMSWR